VLYTSDIVTAQVSEGERLKPIFNNNGPSSASKVLPTDLFVLTDAICQLRNP